MFDRARRLWDDLLDLLFPPRCVSCRRRGAWLCARCTAQVRLVVPPICQRCGQSIAAGDVCPACRRQPPAIDGLRAAAYLEGPLRQAVHRFKYNRLRPLAAPLTELLFAGYTRSAIRADLMVPVPLHPTRQGQRGFNQSLLLAQGLAQRARVPLVTDSLIRTRDTRSQVGLHAVDRRANVRGAFSWQGAGLMGKRVLVIDDVCTTGATLEACAAALYQAGAAAVWGLALARENWGR